MVESIHDTRNGMTARAQTLMNEVWNERNTWANTEQKLVAAIIRKMLSHAKTYKASTMNNMEVIDKNDLITLSKELEQLK
jgi:hypothetical protein